MSVSVRFQSLPVSVLNHMLAYVSGYKNQVMYMVVNETTGKMEYRRNVKEMARMISTGQTNMYDLYWVLHRKMEYPSKPVKIIVEGKTFSGIEHCLHMSFATSQLNPATRVTVYAEYDENGTMNYVYSKGDSLTYEAYDEFDEWDEPPRDVTNPYVFWNAYIYRHDPELNLHTQKECEIYHAQDNDDYTRSIDVHSRDTLEFLHECKARSEAIADKSYYEAKLDHTHDRDTEYLYFTTLSMYDLTYNPYLNAYEPVEDA